MDHYDRFQAIVDECGLTDNPAITDPNFHVLIDELPPRYQKRALGLYYSTHPYNPKLTLLHVPKEADKETIKHEIGHRLGDYYFNNLSEEFAERFRLNKPVLRVAMDTHWAKIGALTAASFADVNDRVQVSLTIINKYSSPISMMGIIEYEVNGVKQEVEYTTPTSETVNPNQSMLIAGRFTMPNGEVKVVARTAYYVGDGEWVEDDYAEASIMVNGSDVIPYGFIYKKRIIYPAAADYAGPYNIGTIRFNALLTIVPSMTWIYENLAGKFIQYSNQEDMVPLEMRIYTKSGSWGSTDYIIQFYAYSTVSQRNAGPVTAPVPILAILSLFVGLLAVVGIFVAILNATSSEEGSNYKRKETTETTNDQDIPIGPRKIMTVLDREGVVTDDGGGDTKVTTPDGNTHTIDAGDSASFPAGSIIIGGTKGATVSLPGQTKYIKEESEETTTKKGTTDWGNIVKTAAIGLGVLGGAILIGNLVSVFKPAR